MKILMLSNEGRGLGIANRLSEEGNDVSIYIRKSTPMLSEDPSVTRVASWRPVFAKTDLIICDSPGFGTYYDLFKSFGKPTFGCSMFFDLVNNDRRKIIDILQRAKINVPTTHIFNTPVDAIVAETEYDFANSMYIVSAPNVIDKTCRNITEIHWSLSNLDKGPIIIQQCVTGNEIQVEGWFNGRDWIRPFLYASAKDISGCVAMATYRETELINNTLLRITPILKKDGYRGPISMKVVVAKDGEYDALVTDLYAGLTFPLIEAMLEGTHVESITDVFFETAIGAKKFISVTSSDVMIAVPIFVWDESYDMPISGVCEENKKHIWLGHVYKDNSGMLRYTNDTANNIVCTATAIGRDIREARNRVYRTIGNIHFPSAHYKSNIGVASLIPQILSVNVSTNNRQREKEQV